jgi:hypothetical protein
MRECRESVPDARVVFAPAQLGRSVLDDLDEFVVRGEQALVLDLTAVEEVDDEAVLLLEWLALRLENAGGYLALTARRAPLERHARRTLRGGGLTRALGVQPALDRAILRRLMARAGGAALW